MCGITGIAGHTNVTSRLYRSLLNLEYRGYDSCGIAVVKGGEIHLRKDKGPVQEVGTRYNFTEMTGDTGIGHTRWATTGIPNQQNAHPHLNDSRDFALVHNGIISNYRELKAELQKDGIQFHSDTDTEVIVNLIATIYYKIDDLEMAMRNACERLEGTFAFVFISSHDPETLYAARSESPLMVGLGDGENYIGSDHNAIMEYTRRVISLMDGEYVIVNRNTVVVKKLVTGESVEPEVNWLDWDPELSKKGGFPHYMLKEIHEQPGTVETILKLEPDQILELVEAIRNASRVYLLGVGTTYYVALIAQYYFSKLAGRDLNAISADEFKYLAQVDTNTLVIAFSQSGETYDTLHALRFARSKGARLAAIINVIGSTMVREVDIPVMQCSGPEICVLSTKAALAQIVLSVRVALELGLKLGAMDSATYNERIKLLSQLPGKIRKVINERKGFINTIARNNAKLRNWLFIGRGIYCGIAMESALKMKEVTYQHAEGMPGGFMKHGTIALIEDGFGSIFFMPPEAEKDLFDHTIANVEEIKARSGFVVGFGFGKMSEVFDESLGLPECDPVIAPLLLLVVGQLFAYYSAVALKRNVDRPRSLAKSVTVA